MAKIVIAGAANCPYFARVELLADKLAGNLPNFRVHKIVKQPDKWEDYLHELCHINHWKHSTSPVIWREPVEFGGTRLYIGGSNEFQEYVSGYYDVHSTMTSCEMYAISTENLDTKLKVDKEIEDHEKLSQPKKVCVIKADTPILYNLLPSLLDRSIFGPKNEIIVYLYDDNKKLSMLNGIAMEVEDMAYPLVRGVVVTNNEIDTVRDADFVLMFGDVWKNPTENNADWQYRIAETYKYYGLMIHSHAKKDVKIAVIVMSNAKLNTAFCASMLGVDVMDKINQRNVIAMTGIVSDHARAVLANRLKVNSALVTDVLVWGYQIESSTYQIDLNYAKVYQSYVPYLAGPPSFFVPILDVIKEEKWLDVDFPQQVAKRSEIREMSTRHSAAMSIADSIKNTLQMWLQGTGGDHMYSICISSEGWYDVPKGLFCYFPVRFNKPGEWTIVDDLPLSELMKLRLADIIKKIEEDYTDPYRPVKSVPTRTSISISKKSLLEQKLDFKKMQALWSDPNQFFQEDQLHDHLLLHLQGQASSMDDHEESQLEDTDEEDDDDEFTIPQPLLVANLNPTFPDRDGELEDLNLSAYKLDIANIDDLPPLLMNDKEPDTNLSFLNLLND